MRHLRLAGKAPVRQRLRRHPDHLAPRRAPELLDRGTDHRSGGLAHRAVPRARAQLWRMGLRPRQPKAVAVAFRLARWAALSDAANAAALVRIPRRHGARAGRS